MSQKRQPEEGGDGGASDEKKRPRVPALHGVVIEALKMDALQKLLAALEPLVRRVVKEEVELALAKHLSCIKRQCGKQVYPSASGSLQLQFMSKLSLPIFTGSKIEGEDCNVVNIALVDGLTGQVVMSGPESSLKVEIVVLEGDFEGDEEDNWTYEDFRNNIVREREGKRSLLTGDVYLELTEGIGVLGELSFTDNSSWTRSRKFRLGASIVDGCYNGTRIKEAKTEPFMVKDHRGELYKKHYPPALMDEVWRLEKIGKDGAFHKRLSIENINTVKDFLTLLYTDATRLRNILGSGMSAKMWEVTVDHARTCTLGSQIHLYYANGQGKNGVVFNVVGQVLGIQSEKQYISVNNLSDEQKADALLLVKAAFEHWNDVLAFDMGTYVGSSSNVPPHLFPTGSQVSSDIFNNFSVRADSYNLLNSSVSSSETIGGTRELDAFVLPSVGSMGFKFDTDNHSLISSDVFTNASREIQRISNSVLFDECGNQAYFGEDTLQYLNPEISLLSQGFVADSPADLGTAVTSFLARSRSTARGKAYVGWKTLISVLQWRFSIKRIVALKKRRVREK
ncbi:calmodulin-binding protein 60 A-like isoform X1 [Dioscorea cayenensis subsp. rotundata]|uniref:Calmodulin-binding protein 60 A-like isoform X1 n=1 Tax=Dioscorea cayennensis subsp. rotundata TaxID=55577 RepID=A0AB40CV25_DIOCR|nr:calmodulin-binding protein 60 A-like isoform X1 [Dioscorea cayenensis subsp. rotundata]